MLKTDFIKTIQNFIADGKTDEALTLLRQEATDNYPKLLNDITLIENRYQTAHNDFIIKGILSKEDYDSRIAKINVAILDLISKLDGGNNMLPATTSTTTAQKNNGRLLHNIPEQMPLQKESRCIVRIAYDDDIIKRDLPATSDTVIQAIRITEVMSIYLLDFNETPCFVIRTITEAEQFIDAGEYTQWIFMVKPLKTGHYPLTLKVTVMEKIDGKERKRDIVLEKEIYILSQVEDDSNKTASGQTFTDTNIVLTNAVQKKSDGFNNAPNQGDMSPVGNAVKIPNAPAALPPIQKILTQREPETDVFVQAAPPTNTKSNRSLTTIITSVFALLIVAGVGLWVTTKSNSTHTSPDVAIQIPDSSAKNKIIYPNSTNKDSSELAQNLPKNNEPNSSVTQPSNPPASPPINADKNHKPSDSDVAITSQKNSDKNKPTKVLPSRPAKKPEPNTGNLPSDVIIAMKKFPPTPATEKLPNIKYAEPTVIMAEKITKNGAPSVNILRPLLIKLNNGAKLKGVQIFVDGQLVSPNLDATGVPVSMSIIAHNGPHTVLLKKGNKTCEYVDVLMINDIATIEGCNLD